MNNLDVALSELLKIFNVFNKEFFENTLPEPIFVIQSSCRKEINGWFSTGKVWKNTKVDESSDVLETQNKNEITLIAEKLYRSTDLIAETVLHESCHYFNNINNIKDTSGVHHNKNFKETAELHGLNVEKDKKFGWARTSFDERGLEVFKTINVNPDAFSFYRIAEPKLEKEKHTTYKYKCPECGNKFTLKFDIDARCKDCDIDFDVEVKEVEDMEDAKSEK
jgi:predicted SprT family Zn-dependent metalloprotease